MKALVIGGSSGVGFAVSRSLQDRGFAVKVLGPHKPETDCEYSFCDLRYPDMAQFEELARDEDINTLFISSGLGRLADFQYFGYAEVDKTFTVHTVSVVKILRAFYDRLLTGGGAHSFAE